MRHFAWFLLFAVLAQTGCGRDRSEPAPDTTATATRSGSVPNTVADSVGSARPDTAAVVRADTAIVSMGGNDASGMESMNREMVAALGPEGNDFDKNFLDLMADHHQGAVAMAVEALGKGNRKELNQLARSIIAGQQEEIRTMNGWRDTWYRGANPSAPVERMMAMMKKESPAMVARLGQRDAGFDRRFAELMIPHHEGAVLMAREAVSKGKHPELVAMARKMIAEQEREIAMMKEWTR